MPPMSGRGGAPPQQRQQQHGQYGGNQNYNQQYVSNGGYGGYGHQQQHGNFQQQGYSGQQQQYPQSQLQQSVHHHQQQQYNQPQLQQQYTPSSYSSRPSNRNPGIRPPDLQSQTSFASNVSTHNNGSTGGSRTPTTPSFSQYQSQNRQQQSLRTNRAFPSPEPSPTGQSQGQQQQAPSGGNTTTGYGASLWNRMMAAKEVINATITGEERWADSDDSDYEGESHVARVLREYTEKKEDSAMAEQIAKMELTISQQQQQQHIGGGDVYGTRNTTKNQTLRDALRKDHSSFASTSSLGDDYSSRSLRPRGLDDRDSNHSGNSASSAGGGGVNLMSRFRAASDASRNDALNKLEGRNQGDALQAQISHLGSTSPRGQRGGGGGLSPNTAGSDRYNGSSSSGMSYSPSSNSLREAYQNRNRSNTTHHQQYGSSGRYF